MTGCVLNGKALDAWPWSSEPRGQARAPRQWTGGALCQERESPQWETQQGPGREPTGGDRPELTVSCQLLKCKETRRNRHALEEQPWKETEMLPGTEAGGAEAGETLQGPHPRNKSARNRTSLETEETPENLKRLELRSSGKLNKP